MRWRFWRRHAAQPSPGPPAAPLPPPRATGATRGPALPDDPDEDRRPTPAFSGASPDPGSSLPATAAGDISGLPAVAQDDPHLHLPGVRSGVLALVRAAVERDRPAALRALEDLEGRGEDAPGVASIAALAALGDRLVAGADVEPATPEYRTAVVAQGDTVAGRAGTLLRAVAPQCPRDLVRHVVRLAAGVPDQEPALVPQDLTLVAAVLLAQTVLDGQGDLDALAEELALLLPG